MPVVMGVRGQLDRLFSPAGSPRTLFAPAVINGTAQASDVVTLGRNGRTDAIWSLDQWDQGMNFHSTAPDPYLEVHGFEPDHDRLVIRNGRGSYWFYAVEDDVDGDGRDDLLLGRYDSDRHGGGDGPGLQGFYDLYAVLDGVSAADLGLTVFAGGRYGEIYWINNMAGSYPAFIQTALWDPLAAEYEAELALPDPDPTPEPHPEPDPTPEPDPEPDPDPPSGGGGGGSSGGDQDHGHDHGHSNGNNHNHNHGHDHDAGGGGHHGGGDAGQGGGDELAPLDPYQRLTDAVARRAPITSRSRKPNHLRGTDHLDVIQPWRGKDRVTGLEDSDAVLLAKRAEFGKRRDVVTDFTPREDHLFLTHRFADYGKRFQFNATGEGLTLQQGQRLGRGFVYDTSTGGLWFNQNGRRSGWGDGGLALQFDGAPAITSADWTVS